MSIAIHSEALSAAEVSFLKWQYGFDDDDEPFERALWQAIQRAWDADNGTTARTRHLDRIGCSGAYPEEVALYRKFKSDSSDTIWNDLILRAGLSDRRTASVDMETERRRAASQT